MKKLSLLFIIVFLVSVGSSFQALNAQEKTKEEQEKDAKIQKDIEKQKKNMSQQKKEQAESEDSFANQKEYLDKSQKDMQVELDNANKERNQVFMTLPRGDRSFNRVEPFILTGDEWNGYFGHMGDSERTTWDFSKTVKENTFSNDYSFDVEKSARTVVMSVMGDCKSGEIRIKIVMPNGKNYSDILIDESGNLNWRKSFMISDTENQDKTGAWKFQISSTKATGFFKISLQSF
jgi:ATPase subunit of ABC transporter with duplicated ATPase domains